MQGAVDSKNFLIPDVEQINHIWLSLNVLTLNDITSIDGKELKMNEVMSTSNFGKN